jgi:hypothetical protein
VVGLVPHVRERHEPAGALTADGAGRAERVVQRERLHVHHARHGAGVVEQAELRVHHLALRRGEQHRHLGARAVGVEHVEVERHRVHVERHVLLGLPAQQRAGLGAHGARGADALDDHVAPADTDHEPPARVARRRERLAHRSRPPAPGPSPRPRRSRRRAAA